MLFGKHINKYYLRYCYLFLFGLLALVTVDYAQLEIPRLYGYVIDGINFGSVEIGGKIQPFNLDFLLDNVCRPLLFIILAMVFGRFLWRICFFTSSVKVETDLRKRMFDRAKNLSQRYYSVNKVGNLMSLFTNDLETVQDCFGWGFMMLFDALILGGMSIFKMAQKDLLLTSLSLIPMVILLVSSSIVGNLEMKKWDERQAAFSSLSDFAQESFSGLAVIKAFVKELKELGAFKKLNQLNEDKNVSFTKVSTLLQILVTLFVESVICVILGYGGYLVYVAKFKASELIEFISYFTAIIWPIMSISELIGMIARGRASLKRIGELLDATSEIQDKPNAVDAGTLKGDIEFRHLTFSYAENRRTILSDITFKIRAGENIGIIGGTGSGKTTLVDLLLRTYNVPDGTIFLDGKDINSMTVYSVRKNMAYVPQDNFLFSDTIENNIAFAGDVNEDEVKRSAVLSAVDDNIIEFTDGYKTVLGERGTTVSGGQKQRISIARALYKNAPILILDDSVSAVDTGTEKTLIENLKKERKGKTTLLIAHRISSVENMDRIIFLGRGKFLGIGTHEELIKSVPEYKHEVELQKLEEEKEDN